MGVETVIIPPQRRSRASSRALLLLSGVAAILLIADFLSLPNTRTEQSTVGSWRVTERRSTLHGRPVPLSFFRTPNGLRAVYRIPEAPHAAGEWLEGVVLFRDLTVASGWWGLTSERQRLIVLGESLLTAEERASLPAVARAAIESGPDGAVNAHWIEYDLLSKGVMEETHPRVSGYVHTSFAATLAFLALCGPLVVLARPIN